MRLALPAAAVFITLIAPTGARATGLLFIRGGGDGHGVGMSQYGAYGYALHGASYRFILGHYYRGTSIAPADPNQTVRVLLSTGQAAFAGASAAGSTALKPGQTYRVRALSDGRLEILDSAGKRVGHPVTAPLSARGPGPLQLAGKGAYRGSLQFRPDGSGGVQTVNAVGLDDYVRGVVAAEMPASWAPQALEAQAVAARTYAITSTVGGVGYDLYDDTRSQMYGGVGSETASSDAAVQATRGQIVSYNGQPVVTYFFSSSGGYTDNVEDSWPGSSPEPWLRGVSDPYDSVAGNPYHRWSAVMSLGAAARKLGGLVRGTLRGIDVTAHGPSSWVLRATVSGSRGSTSASGAALARAFGLLSSNVSFTSITTNASTGRVSGSVYPGRRGTGYAVQAKAASGWHTVARQRLGLDGTYSARVPGHGEYRIQVNSLNGPSVSAPKVNAPRRVLLAARQELAALLRLRRGHGPQLPEGRLARYAWPLAGHRRPLRPVPVLLRAARQHH